MRDTVKLAIDLYKGNTGTFSADQSNEVLRKALIAANGGSDKLDYKSMRRNKVEIFEIIEETLTYLISEGLEGQFGEFAEIRNLAWGDKNEFKVPNKDLYKVAVVADGNGNIRRQRIHDSGKFQVEVNTKAIKIYEEFHRFLAGRIDWAELVSKVQQSYNKKVAEDIYTTVYNSFSGLTSTYGISAAYDEATLTELAQHVEAASGGAGVVVLGTKMALAKVAPSNISENMKEARNNFGFYGRVNGFDLREIKQGHKVGTDDWIIDNNFLMVIPLLGDKFVKIVNEGEALFKEDTTGDNADMSMEYSFIIKSGIATIPVTKYGIYRLA